MKTPFLSLSVLVCLLLFSLVSCKKEEPVINPGGTTNPGSNTNVTTTKSSAKEIKTVVFGALSPAVSATIDASAKTIAATVPASTDVTKLVPTITLSEKATVSPASGVAQDFSKAVTYTVTAEDGSSQTYTITVSKSSTGVSSVCHVVALVGTSTNGGSKTTYQVDDQNRLIQSKYESYDKNGAITTSSTTVNVYDAAGFQTSSTTTYSYATTTKYSLKDFISTYTYQNGRLTKNEFKANYIDTSVPGFGSTTQYEYDSQGNVNKRIYTTLDGTEETTTIANSVVTGITGNKATFGTNGQGFVAKKTNANGTYIVYQYNAAGQNIVQENYNAQGIKTNYTTYQYAATTLNTPTNPAGLKGFPTNVPSAYGISGQTEKTATYTVDAAGKETKTNEATYVYKGNSKGNVASYVYTSSFLSGTSMLATTYNYTYQYEGCQ